MKVGGIGVVVGGMGVKVGGKGVMVGGKGVTVGGMGDEAGPAEGIGGDGLTTSPTVTTERASGPTLPWLSVALALTV